MGTYNPPICGNTKSSKGLTNFYRKSIGYSDGHCSCRCFTIGPEIYIMGINWE